MARIGFSYGIKALSPASEVVNRGVYAATTLSAVDGDLAAANIKDGVVIFGFTGTFSQAAAEDIDTFVLSGINADAGVSISCGNLNTAAEITVATSTNDHAAGSLTYACASLVGDTVYTDAHKLHLYMDGVEMQVSTFWNLAEVKALTDVKSMPGDDKVCYSTLTAPDAGYVFRAAGGETGQPVAGVIGVGSIKVA